MTVDTYTQKEINKIPKYLKVYLGYTTGREAGWPQQKQMVYENLNQLADSPVESHQKIYLVVECDQEEIVEAISKIQLAKSEEEAKKERQQMEIQYEKLKKALGK